MLDKRMSFMSYNSKQRLDHRVASVEHDHRVAQIALVDSEVIVTTTTKMSSQVRGPTAGELEENQV